MKEQYVGDISDYRKYALLRALAASGANRIGVVWMLTPSDGSTDGGKLAYLQQPERFRCHDAELFDLLAHTAAEPDRRRLDAIEGAGAVPGARYFNAPLTDASAERQAYMVACLTETADADLVFFDPDNGLDVPSVKRGNKRSSKYLYLDEVEAFWSRGQSVLIYQHFNRVGRDSFIAACVGRLKTIAADATIGLFRTADVVFLFLLHPSAPPGLVAAAHQAVHHFDPKFISGQLLDATETAKLEAETDNDTQVPDADEPVAPEPVMISRGEDTPRQLDEQADERGHAVDQPPRKRSILSRLIARLR